MSPLLHLLLLISLLTLVSADEPVGRDGDGVAFGLKVLGLSGGSAAATPKQTEIKVVRCSASRRGFEWKEAPASPRTRRFTSDASSSFESWSGDAFSVTTIRSD